MSDGNNKKVGMALAINVFICAVVLTVPILLPKSDKVAVILSPWAESNQVMKVIADAGGVLVNGGQRDWIAVATSESKSFVSELYEAGAVIVIDGAIAAACL